MDNFISILRILHRHRLKLLVIPIITMGLVYYLTGNMPKKYKSDARLYLNLQENKGISLTDEDLKQYQVHSYFQNTIELLKAKRTVEMVQRKAIAKAIANVAPFNLGNEILLEHKNEIIQRLEELNTTAVPTPAGAPDSIMNRYLQTHGLTMGQLKDGILAFRILDSNFMKLELTEDDAEKCKSLLDLYIEALIEENRVLSKNKIRGHKDIIEGLVRQAKADLDEKIKKLERFKVSNNIINLGEHTKAIVVYLVQLEGQRANLLSKIAAGNKGKTEVMDAVRNGNEITLDLATHEEIVTMKKQLQGMNQQLLTSSLQQESDANFKNIEKNVEHIKKQIDQKLAELARKTPYDPSRIQLDLVSKYVAYDLDAETAQHMVPVIDNEIERVTKYSRRFAPFESTIGAYEQEISTAQNVYLTLLNKLSLTESMEFGSGENVVEVIDPPYVPTKPESSKRMLMVAGGGLATAVLAMAVLIILFLLDETIGTVDQFERLSTQRVLAALPQIESKLTTLAQAEKLIQQKQMLKLTKALQRKSVGEIVLIASTEQGEGKHYLAEQLSKAFQQSGVSAAWVDADWMNSSVLENAENWKELVSNNGLLQHDQLLREKLQRLQKEFDTVFVIAAPFNLSGEADFWLTQCTQVLMVFKANRTRHQSDQRTEELLNAHPINQLGVVLNQLKVERMEDYLGEIPRQRNAIRIQLKKLLTRNYRLIKN